METKTAYCGYCKRNRTVVNVMPIKWLQRHIGLLILLVLFLPVIGWIILAIMFIIPGNNFYCEECGTCIGSNTKAKPRCVYCGAELEPEASFCQKCGKKSKVLKESVVCKKCRTENASDSKFCAKCGTKLSRKGHSKKYDTPAEYGWQSWE